MKLQHNIACTPACVIITPYLNHSSLHDRISDQITTATLCEIQKHSSECFLQASHSADTVKPWRLRFERIALISNDKDRKYSQLLMLKYLAISRGKVVSKTR